MGSKYTSSKQGRSHGGYRRRLNARGLGKAPAMSTLESLRNRKVGSAEWLASHRGGASDEGE